MDVMERIELGDSVLWAEPRQLVFFLGPDLSAHLPLIERGAMRFEPDARGFALAVVDISALAPPPEMRTRAGEVFSRAFARLHAFAFVIPGSGVEATTKRTMARVMAGLSRTRTDFNVFRGPDEAQAWLRARARAHDSTAFEHPVLPSAEHGAAQARRSAEPSRPLG